MTDISILILSVSTAVATIIYSLKNIKQIECCYGASSCSQIPNGADCAPPIPRDNNNSIIDLQEQIQNLSNIINDIT